MARAQNPAAALREHSKPQPYGGWPDELPLFRSVGAADSGPCLSRGRSLSARLSVTAFGGGFIRPMQHQS